MSLPQDIPFRLDVVKEYPQRGPLHQYRLSAATSFPCSRCRRDKNAKLVTLIREDWDYLICNGCYGRLLSIWNIKAGQLEDAARDTELIAVLRQAVTQEAALRAQAVLIARESRIKRLSVEALTMLATAEAVAGGLAVQPTELDWSAAIITVCKAVEIELVRLVAAPVRGHIAQEGLTLGGGDKQFRPWVRYCRDGTPPELGSIGFLIKTAADPGKTPTDSVLVAALRAISRDWPSADALFVLDGIPRLVLNLAHDFRNPAAHTGIFARTDYERCNELVVGEHGLLWELLTALRPRH